MESPTSIADLEVKDPALALSHRRKMEILFAVLLGLFLSALDQTIVGTALPTIVGDLHGSQELYTWVVTVYLLTATITGVFYGKLSDLYGRRLMLLLGVSIFLVGSALSGLSWSMESLILFRGIQGIGAGAIFPISLAVIADLFTPKERGKYQGLFGAVFGLSSIIGPLLGGFLTDNVSWHWIFYVNLPIGAVTLYIIYRYLPTVRVQGSRRNLDYLGAAVFAVAVTLLLIGLTNKQHQDWTDFWVGGLIGLSLIATALFLYIESKAAEPIIPLSLFRNRGYAVTILATFLAGIGFFGTIIFLPLWFQYVKGVSPTESGLQVLALLSGVIISSIASGVIVSRTGRYRNLSIGSLAVMSVGILLLTRLNADTELPFLWLWMFITGLGIGPTLSVFTIVVQSVVPFEKLGVATGSLTFFRQVGGSVGLAVSGTILGQGTASSLGGQLAANQVPPPAQGDLFSLIGRVGSDLFQVDRDQTLHQKLVEGLTAASQPFVDGIERSLHQAFSMGLAQSFWFGLGATLVALVVVVLALPEVPLRGFATGRGRPTDGDVPPQMAGH
ncbi:MAG: MDR family MFS transporter [Candidatus Limnocylindrales bacterium]